MKTLNIAGVSLMVSGAEAEHYVEVVPGMRVFEGDAKWEQVSVEFGKIPYQQREYTLLHDFMIAEDDVKCCFGRRDNCYVVEMFPIDKSDGAFVMEYDGERHFVASTPMSATIFRFALWMAFCMVGGNWGKAPIHSSTIVYHGKAILFLGESGTGKSTHTRLWLENIEGARLLNDDSPIISFNADGAWVSGSPWSGKTPCYHQETFPLKAVVRLEQAKVNVMQRLSVLNAVAAMQPSLPPPLAYDNHYMDKMMELISYVVAYVPVYKLRCLPNVEAAQLSCKTIMT